jgi:hypothetical protein
MRIEYEESVLNWCYNASLPAKVSNSYTREIREIDGGSKTTEEKPPTYGTVVGLLSSYIVSATY